MRLINYWEKAFVSFYILFLCSIMFKKRLDIYFWMTVKSFRTTKSERNFPKYSKSHKQYAKHKHCYVTQYYGEFFHLRTLI